jgi:CrcB protein
MTRLALVGLGGFFGAIFRFLVGGWVHRSMPSVSFPVGTLAVNVLGCFAIGLLAGLAESRQLLSPPARLFLLIGFLGSFTTFSTFGYETLSLAQDGELLKAGLNSILHLAVGFAAVWLGLLISRLA